VPQPKKTSSTRAYAAGFIGSWIAAGTFLVGSQTVERFTPLQLGWFRIMLSFVLISVVVGSRGKIKGIARADWPALIMMALAGITSNQLFFLHGIKLASPIEAAMIYAFLPVTVMVAARFTLGETLTWTKVLGILCALAGVFFVLSPVAWKVASPICAAMPSWQWQCCPGPPIPSSASG